MARLGDRDDVGTCRDQRSDNARSGFPRFGDVQNVAALSFGLPTLNALCAVKDVTWRSQRCQRLHQERSTEKALTQFVRPADQAQRGVEDSHPVAKALRLFQAVRGEEDGDLSL